MCGLRVDLGIAVHPRGVEKRRCALDGGGGSGPVGDEAVNELSDFRVVAAAEDFAVDAGDVLLFARVGSGGGAFASRRLRRSGLPGVCGKVSVGGKSDARQVVVRPKP